MVQRASVSEGTVVPNLRLCRSDVRKGCAFPPSREERAMPACQSDYQASESGIVGTIHRIIQLRRRTAIIAAEAAIIAADACAEYRAEGQAFLFACAGSIAGIRDQTRT